MNEEHNLTPFLNLCKNDELYPELIISLSENNILLNDVDFDGNTCIIYACKYNNIRALKYILSKVFNTILINSLNKYNISAFSWAAYNNNTDICDLLLFNNFMKKNLYIKDIYGKYPIEYFNTINSLSYFYNIKIFNEKDFNIVTSSSLEEGTFGEIYNAIYIKHNFPVIIKKYKKCNSDMLLPTKDTIKEILILNKIDETFVVKLYGIIYKRNCIYLVLEKLYFVLDDVIQTLDKKELFKNILYIVNKLHSLGIVHNDIKLNNFMIDNNNNIKLIDFGISNILGFGSYIDSYINNIKFPDMADTIQLEYIDGQVSSFETITYRSSYLTDMFNVGQMFIHSIIGDYKIYDQYIYINGELYSDSLQEGDTDYIFRRLNIDKLNILKQIPFFLDLIKNLICLNIEVRYAAYEALQSEYFTGIKYEKQPFILNKSMNLLTKNITPFAKFIKDSYFEYTTEELINNLYELKYINQIQLSYKNEKIKYINLNRLNYKIIKFLFKLEDIVFDIIINIIILFRTNNISYNTIEFYLYIFYYPIFNINLPSNVHFITFPTIPQFIDYYQITIYPNYIFITLQSLNYDYDNNYAIKSYILKYLLLYFIFSDSFEYKTWDVTQYLFYKCCILNSYSFPPPFNVSDIIFDIENIIVKCIELYNIEKEDSNFAVFNKFIFSN